MTPDDAARLLDRLRMRTEARGATAAEAAAAAELAERIIKRYSLDRDATGRAIESHVCGTARMPSYAVVIAIGLCRRFGVEGDYSRQRGERCIVRFWGPEHTCRVACWLFAAVLKDLDKLSAQHVDSCRQRLNQGKRLRLRNRFRTGAAWEIFRRLNPASKRGESQEADGSKSKRPRRRLRRPDRLTEDEYMAIVAGQIAGREIQLSTDVLAGRAPDRLRLGL